MKHFFLFLLVHFSSFAQDSINTKRWSHEVQLKAYSVLIFPGGFEADYQVNFNLSEHFKLGARLGYFYNQLGSFRYQMLPIYLTSSFPLRNSNKVVFCFDLGSPLFLNEGSKRIRGALEFWVSKSTSTDDNDHFRRRILLIIQPAFKFNIFKGVGVSVGLNSYMTSVFINSGAKSTLFTVGVQLGMNYKF